MLGFSFWKTKPAFQKTPVSPEIWGGGGSPPCGLRWIIRLLCTSFSSSPRVTVGPITSVRTCHRACVPQSCHSVTELDTSEAQQAAPPLWCPWEASRAGRGESLWLGTWKSLFHLQIFLGS
uniref:Uncharacterized protein n=1 Tax=Molossus molossus TaxID=27622 RepID=A0A7J8DTE9_MOLMO|nr:hypothetical protein HJG59_009192 [Molossus molossus]